MGGSEENKGKLKWGAILLLSGLSAGLYSIVIYHLFAFFNLSWLFFANLLFIGFPLGGYIYLRYLDGRANAFGLSLTYLFILMLVTCGFMVLLKYPTMWLTPGIWTDKILLSMGLLSVISVLPFLGFFIGYGIMEVAGYRTGQQYFGDRIYVIYSLYLFGLAIGYVFVSLTIERIGLFRILVMPFIILGFTRLLLNDSFKKIAAVSIIAGLILIAIPGTGKVFFNLIQPKVLHFGLTKINLNSQNKVIYEHWDRASHLTLVDTGSGLYGAYDGMFLLWGYSRDKPPYGEKDHRKATFMLANPNPDILIIGSGGGRDLGHALTYNPKSIVAVEMRKSVIDALSGPFSKYNNNVYLHPSVQTVIMNGRKYLQKTDRKFDIVYLPYVDTLMLNTKTIFDGSELLHTHDSFADIKKVLKPGGIIAIARNMVFDPKMKLFRQYFNSFNELGLHPMGLFTNDRYLLLGFNISSAEGRPSLEKVKDLDIKTIITERGNINPPVVRDDKPYLAGVPGAIISIRSIKLILLSQLIVFSIIAISFALPLSGKESLQKWPVNRKNVIMIGGVVVGINFLAMEYHLIYVLLRNLEQPFDAVFIGTIAFLFITSLGSITSGRRSWKIETALAVVCLFLSLLTYKNHPHTWHLVLLIPAAYMTGRFFPAVFGTTKGRMLRVFAMDSVGAFMATILAGFTPILLGYTAYFTIVTVVFLVTLVIVFLVRNIQEEPIR